MSTKVDCIIGSYVLGKYCIYHSDFKGLEIEAFKKYRKMKNNRC